MHATLSAAFRGLRTLLAECMRNRLLLERVAQKIMHRQLNAAVTQWHWHLQQARRVCRLRTEADAKKSARLVQKALDNSRSELAAAHNAAQQRLVADAKALMNEQKVALEEARQEIQVYKDSLQALQKTTGAQAKEIEMLRHALLIP